MAKKPYYITTAIAYTSGKHISVILMKSFWLTVLHVLRECRDTMSVSRQVQMSMVRRLRSKQVEAGITSEAVCRQCIRSDQGDLGSDEYIL